MTHDGRRPAILAIDTATSRVVIATGSPTGVADGISTWQAGHRHGETLLPSITRFLGEQNIRRSRLTGIVVGSGPGAFTGLRVGIATAKGIAHGLGIPIVGVSTAEALLAASGVERAVLVLPAGPSDRLMVRAGQKPEPLPAGTEPKLGAGERLVALDLEGRAPDDALERGEVTRERLGHELIRMGAERLRAGGPSELETLVPDYVTLPRGVRAADGSIAWSRDHR
ncbi:MAG TPA: tRNA (adenosine(37)-N6)-threonylcarbamoyltransferase complex dimerization subunit type 1 TsaB [Candidatus Limnocylindrales bacterium]|nr:tRNA (adenosine(37)-N6)-threonylcarbamoyltransferase complex dimerization subunit type 1 TsaB [Candidatus Limnocylindrales bacterium]